MSTGGVSDAGLVRALLWDEHLECCGRPVVGAEYMGQQEMLCCGQAEPALLSDAQIVARLRAMFPAAAPTQPAPQPLKERPDFVAGYDAGLADGKRCAERDAPQPQQAPQGAPEGWKLVPAEPTQEMVDAMPFPVNVTPRIGIETYRAMLAAAPAPPAPQADAARRTEQS